MTSLDAEIAALPFNPGVDSVYTYPDVLAYERARLAMLRRVLQEMVDEFGVEHCGIPNCTHCPVVDDARKVLEGTQ